MNILGNQKHRRVERERRTFIVMAEIYCRERHGGKLALCPTCVDLMTYADKRLAVCVFGEEKPTCAKCPIHCYQKEMRVKVREMMRYAGPRMLFHHPILAVLHLLDGNRKRPHLPRERRT